MDVGMIGITCGMIGTTLSLVLFVVMVLTIHIGDRRRHLSDEGLSYVESFIRRRLLGAYAPHHRQRTVKS